MPVYPRSRPVAGITLPVRYLRCRDGDTVEVKAFDKTWAVRLLGVDCPEKREPGGIEAKNFSESVLEDVLDLYVEYRATGKDNPLQALTFDRVPALIWVAPDRTLNELLVQQGHGTPREGWERV